MAFGPEDLVVIYQKLHWLTSMVYPEYEKNLLYLAGPVVRFRLGDIINAIGPEGGRGLPGIIENLDFDYSNALWELQDDFRVPRNIGVSLTFTVLHDKPIGRGTDGRFGGIGTIKDGKYFPPSAQQDKGSGTTTDGSSPNVPDSSENFRFINAVKPNSYTKFSDSDKPEPPKA